MEKKELKQGPVPLYKCKFDDCINEELGSYHWPTMCSACTMEFHETENWTKVKSE